MNIQWRRAVRLGRALSRAAFERETLPPGLPQIQSLIWSATALMAPGLGVIFLFTPRYARLSVSGGIDSAVAGDRVLLVALTMIAMGLAALLLWESTVPSRRDALILSPLPLSGPRSSSRGWAWLASSSACASWPCCSPSCGLRLPPAATSANRV